MCRVNELTLLSNDPCYLNRILPKTNISTFYQNCCSFSLKKYVKGSDRYSGDKKKTRISIAKFLTLRADGREKFVNESNFSRFLTFFFKKKMQNLNYSNVDFGKKLIELLHKNSAKFQF
jgi:hypothetical protein